MAERDTDKENGPLVEFERALKNMDEAMKRVIAATIKLRDTRAGANAKYKY
jgi:hypothetical protein